MKVDIMSIKLQLSVAAAAGGAVRYGVGQRVAFIVGKIDGFFIV